MLPIHLTPVRCRDKSKVHYKKRYRNIISTPLFLLREFQKPPITVGFLERVATPQVAILFFKGILGGRELRNISVVMGLKIEDGIAISSTHTSSVINSSNVDIQKAKKEIEKAIMKINPFHFEFVGALHTNGNGFTRYTKIKGESK